MTTDQLIAMLAPMLASAALLLAWAIVRLARIEKERERC